MVAGQSMSKPSSGLEFDLAPFFANIYTNNILNITRDFYVLGLIFLPLHRQVISLTRSIVSQSRISFDLSRDRAVVLFELYCNCSVRKFFNQTFVNLVSLTFGQMGICLWHSDLTMILVDREHRPLAVFYQCVALTIKIRLIIKVWKTLNEYNRELMDVSDDV
jgi:hypothetical protein